MLMELETQLMAGIDRFLASSVRTDRLRFRPRGVGARSDSARAGMVTPCGPISYAFSSLLETLPCKALISIAEEDCERAHGAWIAVGYRELCGRAAKDYQQGLPNVGGHIVLDAYVGMKRSI